MRKVLFFYPTKAMSLLEILLSLGILVSAIIIVFGVMAQGLMVIKKGENYSVALNIAMAQFEAYKGNFHMIPFYPGIADPVKSNYYYPDRKTSNDINQIGKFVHHSAITSDLPGGDTAYMGATGVSADFYHRANPHGTIMSPPYYDLNQDGYPNDILEPLEPQLLKEVTFTPVVEIKAWNNGFNINEIKHMTVKVYWKEKNASGAGTALRFVTFEGFIGRTKSDPW